MPVAGGDDIFGALGKLAPIVSLFTGSGTKNVSETSQSNAPPELVDLLKGIVNQAQTNANDPSQTDALVQDIIRKASIAFTPELAQAGRSGLYNSSTVSKLASENVANATGAAAQAVTGYKTNQQQIAASGGAALLNALKTTTTNQKVTGAPAINPALLAGGLGALQLYSKKDKLLDMLGLGSSTPTSGTTGPGLALNSETFSDPSILAESGAINVPNSVVSTGIAPGASAVASSTGDSGGFNISDLLGSGGASGDEASIGGLGPQDGDSGFLDVLSNIGSGVSDAGSSLLTTLGNAGSDIADEGSDILDTFFSFF